MELVLWQHNLSVTPRCIRILQGLYLLLSHPILLQLH